MALTVKRARKGLNARAPALIPKSAKVMAFAPEVNHPEQVYQSAPEGIRRLLRFLGIVKKGAILILETENLLFNVFSLSQILLVKGARAPDEGAPLNYLARNGLKLRNLKLVFAWLSDGASSV